jgi:hypothetical protein
MRQRTYDRRGFVAVSALTAFLAACGGDGGDLSPERERLRNPIWTEFKAA